MDWTETMHRKHLTWYLADMLCYILAVISYISSPKAHIVHPVFWSMEYTCSYTTLHWSLLISLSLWSTLEPRFPSPSVKMSSTLQRALQVSSSPLNLFWNHPHPWFYFFFEPLCSLKICLLCPVTDSLFIHPPLDVRSTSNSGTAFYSSLHSVEK